MFEHKNEYPVILVPGLAGYGEDSALNSAAPYFGLFSASAQTVITDMGFPCHVPSFGALSGTWDRACELYAQLVGGTVDYGEAHSKKHGHARYGRTYDTALVPNWGSLDNNGRIVKISLVAHGFGVTVCRQFIELLYNGSMEERAATSEESLSGLFKGGYTQIVNCLVSLAGINSGIPLFQIIDEKLPRAFRFATKAGVLREQFALLKKTGAHAEKNGQTVTQHGFGLFFGWSKDSKLLSALHYDEASVDRYLKKTEDSIFADMGIDAMTKFNNNTDTKDNIYYLSAVGSVTSKVFDKYTIPTTAAGVLAPTAALVSTYENYLSDRPVVTDAYHENDGLVSVTSALPSMTEPVAAFKDAAHCLPGTWYQIPIENKNHLAYVGLFQRPDKYRNAIYDLMKIISNFEIV